MKKEYGLRGNITLELVKPTELVVCPPLSAYTSSEVADASLLHTRLKESNEVPPGWMILEQSTPTLALCKVQFCPLLHSSNTTFTLVVDQHCLWTLKLGDSEVRAEHCQLLAGIGSKLSSVDALVKLLLALNQSRFCVGNCDENIMQLAKSRKGVFKDHSGKLVIQFLISFMCIISLHFVCS